MSSGLSLASNQRDGNPESIPRVPEGRLLDAHPRRERLHAIDSPQREEYSTVWNGDTCVCAANLL